VNWIPVSKALPALDERVLIAGTCGVVTAKRAKNATLSDELRTPAFGWATETGWMDPRLVTHWMPLPPHP